MGISISLGRNAVASSHSDSVHSKAEGVQALDRGAWSSPGVLTASPSHSRTLFWNVGLFLLLSWTLIPCAGWHLHTSEGGKAGMLGQGQGLSSDVFRILPTSSKVLGSNLGVECSQRSMNGRVGSQGCACYWEAMKLYEARPRRRFCGMHLFSFLFYFLAPEVSNLLCHAFPPTCAVSPGMQRRNTMQPWTGTSEIVSQNKLSSL